MSDVFVIHFYNYSISLAEFLVGLIVTGVILSIFLSFVNINNVRSSYSRAEFNSWNARQNANKVKAEKSAQVQARNDYRSAERSYAKMYNEQLNKRR